MDLFGDLPEPSTKKTPAAGANLSLYDDEDLAFDLSSKSSKKADPDDNSLKRKSVDTEVERRDDVAKKKKSARFSLQSFLAERQGEREDMQDAHLILHNYAKLFPALDPSIYRLSLFGVFDGHGGAKASRFASENLHKILQEKFPKGDVSQVEKDIKKVFIETFKKADEEFLKEAAKYKPVWKDGTTAILILVINETLYIANIGDSQAVLCRYKEESRSCVAVPLSTPHNPSMYDERMRIQRAGGQVTDGRVMGVLEVSRSIGDGQYKKLGVTCLPDIRKCQLTNNDRFVLIACDGLWKTFEPLDSIKFVNEVLQDKTIQGTDTKSPEEVQYETACSKLANEAVLRLSADNVTVLLLSISPS